MDSNLSQATRPERIVNKHTPPTERTDEVALIERLLDFKTERVKEILQEVDLPHSGSKVELRYIVEEAIKEKIISVARLEEFVTALEPYSHRHLYFFKVANEYTKELTDDDTLSAILKKSSCLDLLRPSPSFRIPGLLKPNNIEIDGHILRIKFIAPVHTSIRRPELDTKNQITNLISRIYEEKLSRKLYLFELNLKTGKGFISIPAIQRGQTFPKEFRTIAREVERIIGLKGLEIISIGAAIKNLMGEDKSVSRTLGVRYSTGDTIKIKSPKKGIPLFSNQIMKPIETHTRKGDYFECDFYYAEGDQPQFRFMVYEDERLGIMTDLDEGVFRDVIKLVLGNL